MKKFGIIVHLPENQNIVSSIFLKTLHSITKQSEKDFELFLIGQSNSTVCEMLRDNKIRYSEINDNGENYAKQLNEISENFSGSHLLYLDNREKTVILKNACLETFAISAERHPAASFFYSDYELDSGSSKSEVKLLFHHIGRVRDNQDYGSVYFLNTTAIHEVGGFDENLNYMHWYDMRLKLSEVEDIIRIGNKYSGSLYTINAEGQSANVFDYLMSSKELQLEAEMVLTNHLKRIEAYLPPGEFMELNYEADPEATLEASVIIPVGHRPEFISTAIESIQAQSVQNIEAIIVVNGGSDDPTATEVKRYMKGGDHFDPEKPEIRLIVIDVNNIGLCLNIGAKQAKGKYYVQLDSDDRLKADAVEKILNVFSANPKVGMVIGSYEVWEKKNDGKLYRMDEIPVVTHDEWTAENGRNNLLRINGAGAPRCIPIPLVKAMGYFSVNDDAFARNYGEDYEMVNKISECFEIGRIYDPIYEVVRHSGGTDHAISQDLIDRNDEAKDDMRREAILRRIGYNELKGK